jgi:hypothetical protein
MTSRPKQGWGQQSRFLGWATRQVPDLHTHGLGMSLATCRTLALDAYRMYGLRPATYRVLKAARKPSGWATGMRLPRHCRTVPSVLLYAAHGITEHLDPDAPPHGWTFCRIYIELLAAHAVADRYTLMRTAREAGLNIGTPAQAGRYLLRDMGL